MIQIHQLKLLSVTIGAFDGRVACHFGQHGKYLITSPNADYIPEPAWGRRNIRIRADFRYGLDDYTLWAQPHLKDYPHLAAIPKKPTSPNHPLSIMWYDAPETDFVHSPGSAIRLGKLALGVTYRFRTLKEQLASRVNKYTQNANVNQTPKFIGPLSTAMRHSLIRLEIIDSTLQEMRFGITEFQRYFLELHGLMDYLEIYQPRMLGLKPTATTVSDCIGAFVSTPQVVQEFFDAGIPVWLMRTAENFGSSVPNILSIVIPQPPSQIVMEDATPAFQSIFTGHAVEQGKYAAMHTFGRTFLVFRDPFQDEATPATDRDPMIRTDRPSVSSTVSMRELQQRSVVPKPAATATLPQTRQRRRAPDLDKFIDPDSPLIPPQMPVWSIALKEVQRNDPQEKASELRKYAFPEPRMFVSSTDSQRKLRYLINWLRFRQGLKWRLSRGDGVALPSQLWRDFLNMDMSHKPEEEGTKASKRKSTVREIFGNIETIDDTAIVWRDVDIDPQVMPDPPVIMQILSELYELNFRCELLALNRRLTSLTTSASNDLLRKCFYGSDISLFQIVVSQNRGLASNRPIDRRQYVTALVNLMSSWKGLDIPANFSRIDNCNQAEFLEIEDAAARFYTQQFYNISGRAPIIPHCLL
jgi:hypothetical protein